MRGDLLVLKANNVSDEVMNERRRKERGRHTSQQEQLSQLEHPEQLAQEQSPMADVWLFVWLLSGGYRLDLT
jgi:hypothetical protein